MKKVSDKKRKWNNKYRAQIKTDDAVQYCAVESCGKRGTKLSLQRHHPKRRLGKNILIYVYVCPDCHVEIERGKHPELLPRDGNEHEKKFHGLKPGENMLKTNE